MNQHDDVAVPPDALRGIRHLRLTVTDIERSKAFSSRLLGIEPAIDFTDRSPNPATDSTRRVSVSIT